MVITYLANVRLPTEKAHGLQIVQNCEALAAEGAAVTLVVPRRWNRTALAGRDVWEHYGVARTFSIRQVPCLDLFPLGRWFEPVAARLQMLTFALAATATVRMGRPDAIFTRDVLSLALLNMVSGVRHVVYEAHQMPAGRLSGWLQRLALRRVTLVVAVTNRLAERLRSQSARHVIVLRDGFRPERFARMPDEAQARREVGVPAEAFCVGYVGQVETMGMAKGLDVVIEALSRLRDDRVHLYVVGGPPGAVAALREAWTASGQPGAAFHAPGDVPAARVPRFLAAFDVAVMLLPWTPHFAYCASPLKLFEYMASSRAIVVSSLPSILEVVQDGITALVVPPDDAEALAAALARLRDDAALRERLGAAAHAEAAQYAWPIRARRLLDALDGGNRSSGHPASAEQPQHRRDAGGREQGVPQGMKPPRTGGIPAIDQHDT